MSISVDRVFVVLSWVLVPLSVLVLCFSLFQFGLLGDKSTVMPAHEQGQAVGQTLESLTEASSPSPVSFCSQQEIEKQVFEKAATLYQRNMKRRGFLHFTPKMGHFLDIWLAPVYPCPFEERVGKWGDGGKWLCNVIPLSNESIIYSVGSRGETSFEEGMFQLSNGALSHTFDPFVKSPVKKELKKKPFLHYYEIGLASVNDQKKEKRFPMKNTEEIMAMLGHDHVDVLKMDCEGCELGIVNEWLNLYGSQNKTASQPPPYKQVLIEFHSVRNVTIASQFMNAFHDMGYLYFHAEQNPECSRCYEFAFIHRSYVGI